MRTSFQQTLCNQLIKLINTNKQQAASCQRWGRRRPPRSACAGPRATARTGWRAAQLSPDCGRTAHLHTYNTTKQHKVNSWSSAGQSHGKMEAIKLHLKIIAANSVKPKCNSRQLMIIFLYSCCARLQAVGILNSVTVSIHILQ